VTVRLLRWQGPGPVTTPRRERAVPLLIQVGSLPVRPSTRPGSLCRGESAGFPLCLRASVVKVCLGDWVDRPFRARGLMGVPLTQAVGLGFVRSPLWGSKTTADFARLGFVRTVFHFLLKRGTKAVVARS
jgi:hypothetical protein